MISARINAVLRRTAPSVTAQRFEEFGAYVFDRLEGSVALRGERITLTAKEFALAGFYYALTALHLID